VASAEFDVTISICSWNTVDDLRVCLTSLAAIREEANFEVFVVDNNSEDGSAEMVEAEFPWVRLERSATNRGFTGGHNHAAELRRGEHLFPLNSDAVVRPGAVRELLNYLAANPEVGIVGPRLLNPDGSLQFSCRRFPNPVAALFRNTPLGKLFPKNRFTRDYLMQEWNHDGPREVDWVSGAAFIIRGELIRRIGLFDPEYFMFCEDVDLCWRAWKAGSKVHYFPSPTVVHAIGHSTDKAPNRMIGRFHRSMFRFFAKNRVPELPILARPFALAFAATALLVRASVFVAGNKMDILRRR